MLDLGDATHVFSFWTGIPPAAQRALGKLFEKSTTARVVAIAQHAFKASCREEAGVSMEEGHMRRLGFGRVFLLGKVRLSMQGG